MRPKCRISECSNTAPKGRTICHKCRSRQYKENKPFRYFYNAHKQKARQRCIPWSLTFGEFKQLWEQSGKWEAKLRGEDWSMNRIDVNRGYEIGNIEIIPIILNVQVWFEKDRWRVDFRWRERWSKRNNKPIDECPF